MNDRTIKATNFVHKSTKYLLSIAKRIPSRPKHDDLAEYLSEIFKMAGSRGERLRLALGFPSEQEAAQVANECLINRPPAALAPMLNVLAARLYFFFDRLRYNLLRIRSSEALTQVHRLDAVNLFLWNHGLVRAPKLTDLEGVFSSVHSTTPFTESAADPLLYAVLRAFAESVPDALTTKQKLQLRNKALRWLYDYLQRICNEGLRVDDYSNAWWAMREGICAGRTEFVGLLAALMAVLRDAGPPRSEILAQSLVPETMIDLKAECYTLSNLQAIRECDVEIPPDICETFDQMVDIKFDSIQGAGLRKNLYLACVQHEAVQNYLDYLSDRIFDSLFRKSEISLSDFSPVPGYACVDPNVQQKITELISGVSNNGKHRQLILIYGASSTGKTFLVERIVSKLWPQINLSKVKVNAADRSIDVGKAICEILNSSKEKQNIILIDEFDTKRKSSIFPELLNLCDNGRIGGTSVSRLIMFVTGSSYGDLSGLRAFLKKHRTSKKWEKGLDFYNRAHFRVDLPEGLLEDQNLMVAAGLQALAFIHGTPVVIDKSVIRTLRYVKPDRGLRGVRSLAENTFKCDRDVITVPDKATGETILLT